MLNDNHQFLLLSAKLAELCKPIAPFGIHHVTYFKQLSNGKRISLSNNPQWIADYYNLELYKSSLFERPADNATSSFDAWYGDYDLEVYRHGKLYFNTSHTITIVEYKPESCETFFFSTTPENTEAINFLTSNREILYHFILYLKDSGLEIFTEAEKHAIMIPGSAWKSIEPATNWFQDSSSLSGLEKLKADFLAATPIKRVAVDTKELSAVNLTQREVECIHYMLNYKTVSESASMMNLSQRTVESYLENIKNKLSCNTKSELLQLLRANPYWPAF
jgi:DNA-binding CsgD family transcriptional regulator